MEDLELRLESLGRGMPALTSAFGGMLAEAGAICLNNRNHSQGVTMTVRGSFQARARIYWPEVTPQMLACYNDIQEAVEHGAYGVAILLVKKLLNMAVVERSVKGPGFDYWIGDLNALPFQGKARLEVSGILNGDNSSIRARGKEKERQTMISDGGFPAHVVVVEFGRPESWIKNRESNTTTP